MGEAGVPLYVVDAFTDVAFRGNPAAVVVLDRPGGAEWMHNVAAEMNLSETAFCSPRADGDWDLRWFTPRVEADLCGHATLATAHVLFTSGRVARNSAPTFITRSGALRSGVLDDGRIELDMPARPVEEVAPAPGLLDALGVASCDYSGRNANGYELVQLADESSVRSLRPDFAALAALAAVGEHRSVTITAPASNTGATPTRRYDFVSRYFVPSAGIDEDPVTGAAHCILGPYWAERLARPVVTGLQVSARTGIVECEPQADRVRLRGAAVMVVSGELLA